MKRYIPAIFILILTLVGNQAIAGSLLPDNLRILDDFKPGKGPSVGMIQLVKGKVIIIHSSNLKRGYPAVKNLPVYNGDIIITRKKARISIRMNDGSVLTLAAMTRMEINSTLFDPSKEIRSTLLSMKTGKGRFRVMKLVDFKVNEFKVKTSTALIRVGGSDFIIEAHEDYTHVSAFEKTRLEIVNLAGPCKDYWDIQKMTECGAKPAIISDFEQAILEKGALSVKPGKFVPGARPAEDLKGPPPIEKNGMSVNMREKLERHEEISERQKEESLAGGIKDLPLPPEEP